MASGAYRGGEGVCSEDGWTTETKSAMLKMWRSKREQEAKGVSIEKQEDGEYGWWAANTLPPLLLCFFDVEGSVD
jgi:hypothetical protein